MSLIRSVALFQAVLGIIACTLIITGCEGGPAFLRGATLRPVPDRWFPISERHYAEGQCAGIRVKATGFVHHGGLNFDFFVTNTSKEAFRLCEGCAWWAIDDGSSLQRVSLACLTDENYLYDNERKAFVLSPGVTLRFQGMATRSLRKGNLNRIRFELLLLNADDNESKFSTLFELP